MDVDIVIVGGGPGGLSAALALGRARRRVLLCDAGPRRNAAAEHMHNFVTRDGTPPSEFRRIGREQLAPYESVTVRDELVQTITGERGAFDVTLASGERVRARGVVLATGMVDELPPIEGLRELWGTSVHICPYCHGWEVRDRRFGYLATHAERLTFALLLRSWTSDVTVFTDGKLAIPDDIAALFAAANVRIEARPLVRLQQRDGVLVGIEVAGGVVERDVLFMHPKQRQVALVTALGLALDPGGYVVANEMRETSVPGIFAGGDLVTPAQTAIGAAASAVFAASGLNHALALDDARRAMRPA